MNVMVQKTKGVNPWYLIIALGLVTVLVWFFVETIKSKQIKNVTAVDLQKAQPLEATIDMEVVRDLTGRLILREDEMMVIPLYTDSLRQSGTAGSSGQTATGVQTQPVSTGSGALAPDIENQQPDIPSDATDVREPIME